jgi:predicted RNase H-like HicB family nuclease
MATKTISINAKLLWIMFQDRASGYWVGVCDLLNLSVQGKTVAELHEIIEESLNALFTDLLERKELDVFLRQHNWTVEGKMPQKAERARFDIPYNIERRMQNDLQGVLG